MIVFDLNSHYAAIAAFTADFVVQSFFLFRDILFDFHAMTKTHFTINCRAFIVRKFQVVPVNFFPTHTMNKSLTGTNKLTGNDTESFFISSTQ